MLKKAITIILALAMMSGTSVFASNVKSVITWHYQQRKLQL